MNKTGWSFSWDDRTGQTGPMSRKRIAELLQAARSRGEQITRTDSGYSIGYALRLVRQASQIEEEPPLKAAGRALQSRHSLTSRRLPR